MKKYIHYYAIAVLILVFAGCSNNDDFQAEEIDDSSYLLKSAETQQFKINKASGFLEFNYSPENVCFTNFAQNRNYGTGTASHFGKITLESV
jgi:PBP1b-binding outer membrane lipoprotein LpoB